MISFEELNAPVCSRAGCRAHPQHEIRWRNPKIHTADRRKVWLSCDDHIDFLRDFLVSRQFPLEVVDFAPPQKPERS